MLRALLSAKHLSFGLNSGTRFNLKCVFVRTNPNSLNSYTNKEKINLSSLLKHFAFCNHNPNPSFSTESITVSAICIYKMIFQTFCN